LRLRRCEKIENRENSPSQVVDYQWVHFALLSLSPIFSQLLRHGALKASSMEQDRAVA